MAAWIQDIFYWLTIGPLYYVLVFLISFSESLALIGLFVPGSTLIVFAGFLAANGKGDYPTLILVSVAGAILGDLLSYWFGARLGASFLHRPAFRRYAGLIKKSEIFFVDHGGKSVFLGRFIGFLRPFIPFIAGHARMRPLPFAVIAVISGILWGLVYPGLGFFFGTSWQLVELWVGRFSYLLAALVILLLGNHLFWKHLAPQLSRWAATSWRHIALTWDKILLSRHMRRLATRYPSLWQFLAARFSLHQGTGLYLTVGFCGVVFFAALFIQIIGPLTRLDRQIYRWLAGMQHPAS
ncbi:MAG: DedA family protein, partial [Desulfuromonadaceae bacterium]